MGKDDNRFQDLAKMTGFHHIGLKAMSTGNNKFETQGFGIILRISAMRE